MTRIRKTIVSVALAMSLCTLAACGQEEAKQPTPSEVTAAVVTEMEFPSAVEKGLTDLADYYDISGEVEDASFYICGSGAYPDEVAVIKFKDNASATAAKAALEKRLANQIELYETYTPDEMYKLDNAFIEIKSNYAIFSAVSDNAKSKTIINSYF